MIAKRGKLLDHLNNCPRHTISNDVNVLIRGYFTYVDTLYSSNTGVYPKVSGLAAWSENCKWYSSLPLCAVV
jgi:hypothetical protein